MTAPRTLTVAAVAEALGVHPNTVYRAVQRCEIPNVALGRAVRIPSAWLDERLAAATTRGRVAVVAEGSFS